MKAFRTEDVFPLSLDETWGLLHAHVDEDRLRTIHPRIISGHSIREGESIEFRGLSEERAVVPCGMDREAFVQPIRSRGCRVRKGHEPIDRAVCLRRSLLQVEVTTAIPSTALGIGLEGP